MPITREEAQEKLNELRDELKANGEDWSTALAGKLDVPIDPTPNPQTGISSSELNSANPRVKEQATREAGAAAEAGAAEGGQARVRVPRVSSPPAE